jgi:hypothetical protein
MVCHPWVTQDARNRNALVSVRLKKHPNYILVLWSQYCFHFVATLTSDLLRE